MINAAGRNIPEAIAGYKSFQPYAGPFALIPTGRMVGPKIRFSKPGSEKLLKSIDQAIDAAGLTVSANIPASRVVASDPPDFVQLLQENI